MRLFVLEHGTIGLGVIIVVNDNNDIKKDNNQIKTRICLTPR